MPRTIVVVSWLLGAPALGLAEPPPAQPIVRTADLDVGETQELILSDGQTVTLTLVGVQAEHDEVNRAVRSALVTLEVNGQRLEHTAQPYRLPVAFGGVQLDVPITRDYVNNANGNAWALDKDARVRVWPGASPWITAGTFAYPARQRWFASATQMANEPVYVDGGDTPHKESIYYHYGLDIGGAEGRVDVLAATDGLVVSSGKEVLPGFEESPVSPRYDVVYVRDYRGWFYRYSHLQSIEPEVRPGQRVEMGQKIGLLGKEGGSGGWSHLHFEIRAPQPSGRYGVMEGYAFLWQAYQQRYGPPVRAVARPHHLIWAGRSVQLDGSKSAGRELTFKWTFTDGTTAEGARVSRTYLQPGSYSERLEVTDAEGNRDVDFAIVQVLDESESLPPTIHPSYAPTFNIRPGYQVTFRVRTFRSTDGEETWDFGDGSPPATTKSDHTRQHDPQGYATTAHRFKEPGMYVVTVRRTDRAGRTATGRVVVRVE